MVCDHWQLMRVAQEGISDQQDVQSDECQKDGRQCEDRFLDPAQVHRDHHDDDGDCQPEFVRQHDASRKLKIASAPLAIEIATVST